MKPSRTLAGLLGTEAFQQLQSGKGRGAETREEQSRNNSAALGQGPGSTSSNTHRSVFKLFFRAVNKTPTKWKMLHHLLIYLFSETKSIEDDNKDTLPVVPLSNLEYFY